MSTAIPSPRELVRLAAAHVAGFTPAGRPIPLQGGLLNHVWRLPGRPAPLIAKYAPPYLASAPDVPLDANRLHLEAKALALLSSEGPLGKLCNTSLRPPRPLAFLPEASLLFMEDVGPSDDLQAWLYAPPDTEAITNVAVRLARFVARLHAATSGDATLAEGFHNQAIQETRRAVQYEWVATMPGRLPIPDGLARAARDLGDTLLNPGKCLVMGDLWPRSILLGPSGTVRLIDWEFAHFGRPLQDVAHLDAHLWMLAHRAPGAPARAAVSAFRTAFVTEYAAEIERLAPGLYDDAERAFGRVHFACELLVRAAGPFQQGYLYEGLLPDAPPVQEVFLAITDLWAAGLIPAPPPPGASGAHTSPAPAPPSARKDPGRT